MGATFTCTAPGTFQVGVTISDGTPGTKCPDSAAVSVTCTTPPSAKLTRHARLRRRAA
jgi:hypothetical protein